MIQKHTSNELLRKQSSPTDRPLKSERQNAVKPVYPLDCPSLIKYPFENEKYDLEKFVIETLQKLTNKKVHQSIYACLISVFKSQMPEDIFASQLIFSQIFLTEEQKDENAEKVKQEAMLGIIEAVGSLKNEPLIAIVQKCIAEVIVKMSKDSKRWGNEGVRRNVQKAVDAFKQQQSLEPRVIQKRTNLVQNLNREVIQALMAVESSQAGEFASLSDPTKIFMRHLLYVTNQKALVETRIAINKAIFQTLQSFSQEGSIAIMNCLLASATLHLNDSQRSKRLYNDLIQAVSDANSAALPLLKNAVYGLVIEQLRKSIEMRKKIDTRYAFEISQAGKRNYFFPGYLRMHIKNFSSVNCSELFGVINVVLFFTVSYKGYEHRTDLIDAIKNSCSLQFHRNQPKQLKQTKNVQVKVDEEEKTITFTMQSLLQFSIDYIGFWFPLKTFSLGLFVTVSSIYPSTGQYINFNLMDLPDSDVTNMPKMMTQDEQMDVVANHFTKISLSKLDTFGVYRIANALLSVTYANSEPNELIQWDDIRPNCFQYASFQVPMFTQTLVSYWGLLINLWILSLFNIFIFFQQLTFAVRISNTLVLVLTMLTVISALRKQIPRSSNFLFFQILIILMVIPLICNLFDGVLSNLNDKGKSCLCWTNPWLLISVSCDLLAVIPVIILSFLQKFLWRAKYLVNPKLLATKRLRFDPSQWSNPACSQYFNQFVRRQ